MTDLKPIWVLCRSCHLSYDAGRSVEGHCPDCGTWNETECPDVEVR